MTNHVYNYAEALEEAKRLVEEGTSFNLVISDCGCTTQYVYLNLYGTGISITQLDGAPVGISTMDQGEAILSVLSEGVEQEKEDPDFSVDTEFDLEISHSLVGNPEDPTLGIAKLDLIVDESMRNI